MELRNCAFFLYDTLKERNVKNRINVITKLFKIDGSTFYRWYDEYKINVSNLKNNIFYNFKSILS